jgi:hypothetical protein
MTNQEPNSNKKPIEARITLDDQANRVLKHLVMGAADLINGSREAIFHSRSRQSGGGMVFYGLIESEPIRRKNGLHFSLAIVEGRATVTQHIRCPRPLARQIGGLAIGDRVTLTGHLYSIKGKPPGVQVVYIEKLDAGNLDALETGMLTWGALNTGKDSAG